MAHTHKPGLAILFSLLLVSYMLISTGYCAMDHTVSLFRVHHCPCYEEIVCLLRQLANICGMLAIW